MADGNAAWGMGPAQLCPDGLKSVIGFAGGGGSSVAYWMATGRTPDACYNHWSVAVGAHQRHFPRAEHHCADALELDPDSVLPGEDLHFGWFSPDCTDFSKAKGKAPRSERIRGLAWTMIPWAVRRRIKKIFFENVEEFLKWGPVYRCPDDWRAKGVAGVIGEPIAALRGVTMALFRRRWAQAGYWMEFRERNAAASGAPTTRNRLYGIAHYVGVERVTRIALGLEPSPVIWPVEPFAPRKKAAGLGLKPYRGFCEVADWSQPCPSIFLTPEEVDQYRMETGKRVQRPLVAATESRIYRGLERYVIAAGDDAYIVPITQKGWGGDRAHGVRDPLRTVTSAKGGEFALVSPGLVGLGGRRAQSPPVDIRAPAPTITGKPDGAIVTATLASVAHGDPDRAWPVDEPVRTQTEKNDKAMIAGSLVRTNFHSAAARNGVRDVREPMATVTGDGGFGFAGAYLVPRYGERAGQAPRALDAQEPLATIVPDGNQGSLVAAHLVRQFGSAVGGRDIEDPLNTVMSQGAKGGGKDQLVAAYMAQGNFGMLGRSCCDPMTTATGRGTQQQLVAAHLDTYYGEGSVGSDLADPMRAATAKARMSMITAWLEQANTGMVGHDARDPVSTIVAGGGGDSHWGPTQRLVQARLELDGGPIGRRAAVLEFLWKHTGLPTEAEWLDPAGTLEARKKFGLVIIADQVWMIVDIGLRMLTPAELAGAMGLPPQFDLTQDAHGAPISKTHQTQMIGNMVSPPPAAALIAANCPELILPGWDPVTLDFNPEPMGKAA